MDINDIFFKIILIILIIRILYLIFIHLSITFYNKATDIEVNNILNDPREYVRSEHMCKFMYNMVWLYIFIKLLIMIYSGNISINFN